MKIRKEVIQKKEQLISAGSPFQYLEAYNNLRTNFCFAALNGQFRKILVTSTQQDEGKTSVAINLAISLAQSGSKVLLVDADMRNPSVCHHMDMVRNYRVGLSTLLSGGVAVSECLMKTDYGFDVISGGVVPPNPAELIGSKAMESLLATAAQHYDYVICDAPPVGVVTDAAVLSAMCDGVLFVVRARAAKRRIVRSALDRLNKVNAKILGTVLNQCELTQVGKDYYYRRSIR